MHVGRLALGVRSAHNLGAILNGLSGMECPLFPREALEEDLGIRIDSQITPCLSVGRAGGDGGIASSRGLSQRRGGGVLESLHLCESWRGRAQAG